MPGLPYPDTSISMSDAQMINTSRLQYPNPFFDLSRHYFPKSVKTLFKYCRIFFYQNEFIHNVITKLATYPITDFIYEHIHDETIKQNYKELAEHHLKLKSFLVECGLDYFVYGNCIVSANMKFKRFLECPVCTNTEPAERIKYRWVNFEFVGDCDKCSNKGVHFKIVDRYLKNPKYFKLIRWAPENINIDYDELTGEMRYFYSMNEKTRKGILNGKREIIERVPALFIQSIKENKKIELDAKNLYHFKRPTLAEEDQGWGKPLLLPSMKLLWYMQTLRRGNEAIVAEHLIPMRTIFPSSQGNLDPFCLSPEAWVYTADGVKQLKNVQLTDQLVTETGAFTKIIAMTESTISTGSMYELSLYGLSAFKHISTDIHPYKISSKPADSWKKAKDLTTEDYISYPVRQFAKKNTWLNTKEFIPTLRKHKHILPSKIHFTEEVAHLFGLYLAEGCATEYGKLEFCFNSKEVNYIAHVKNVLDSWLPDTETKIIETSGNYVQVQKYSVELQTYFSKMLGSKCIEKTLRHLGPLTKKQAVALLKGLFEGDGTFFYEQNKYPRLHLKSINFGLLSEIRDLLLSLKLYPSIVKDHSYTGGKKQGVCYQLKLQGYQAECLADLFGWTSRHYYSPEDLSSKFLFLENKILVKVESIKKSKEQKFIALEVADASHSYLSVGAINHNTQMNLGQWKSSVEEQLLKWRKDPNSLGIFPIPIGYQSLGGDAKMLMLTPEMKYLEESIIESMGVPIEFIKGGSTWTSSSVSLRIVENGFLNYREQITEFLNYFVVPKVKYFLGYPPVHLKLKKFKMSDDIQAKDLLLQLAQLGKLADSTLLDEFGIDPIEERQVRKADSAFANELVSDQMKQQAEAQGKSIVIQARYEAMAQAAAVEQAARNNESKFQAELVRELGVTDANPSDVLQKQAIIVQNMPPDKQQQYLQVLAKQAPYSFSFLMARLTLSGAIASPMEQREHDTEIEKEQIGLEQSKVEGKNTEKEHGYKMEESKAKMKEDEHKMMTDEHKLTVEERRLKLKKEEAKIPAKKTEKK